MAVIMKLFRFSGFIVSCVAVLWLWGTVSELCDVVASKKTRFIHVETIHLQESCNKGWFNDGTRSRAISFYKFGGRTISIIGNITTDSPWVWLRRRGVYDESVFDTFGIDCLCYESVNNIYAYFILSFFTQGIMCFVGITVLTISKSKVRSRPYKNL